MLFFAALSYSGCPISITFQVDLVNFKITQIQFKPVDKSTREKLKWICGIWCINFFRMQIQVDLDPCGAADLSPSKCDWIWILLHGIRVSIRAH